MSDILERIDYWMARAVNSSLVHSHFGKMLVDARDEIAALRRGLENQIAVRKAAEANADMLMVSNGALTEELRGQGPGDAVAFQIHDEARNEALEEIATLADQNEQYGIAAQIRALKTEAKGEGK